MDKLKANIIYIILLIPVSLFVLALLLVSVSFCNKISKIIINKGFRRPLFTIPFCLPRYIKTKNIIQSKRITFTQSCITNQNHTNKLFGFSVGGLFSIHKNSFRFGFKSKSGKLYAVAYFYINKQRFDIEMLQLSTGTEYIMAIERSENKVVFSISNDGFSFAEKEVLFNHTSNKGLKLGIYYGGKPKAPHDINLIVKNTYKSI